MRHPMQSAAHGLRGPALTLVDSIPHSTPSNTLFSRNLAHEFVSRHTTISPGTSGSRRRLHATNCRAFRSAVGHKRLHRYDSVCSGFTLSLSLFPSLVSSPAYAEAPGIGAISYLSVTRGTSCLTWPLGKCLGDSIFRVYRVNLLKRCSSNSMLSILFHRFWYAPRPNPPPWSKP